MICYAMMLLCCYVLFVYIFSTWRHVIKLKMMILLNLTNIVPDKTSSVAFLQQRGIRHNPRNCWRYSIRGCRVELELRKGILLENFNLSYRKVVLFIYCWSREMTSRDFCEREIEINKNTVAVDWNNFLCEVFAAELIANPIAIGGPNTTVEVDESLFARIKNHQGRNLPQQWVFGGICRETRECFMYTAPDRSAATLLPIIAQSILPGSTVMPDLWAAHGGIGAMRFQHHTVNHTLNFVDPVTGTHTQNVKNSRKNAKRRNKKQPLSCYHCCKMKLLHTPWRAILWISLKSERQTQPNPSTPDNGRSTSICTGKASPVAVSNNFGEDRLLMLMGPLHIEMAFLNVIGDWLESNGWVNLFVKANVSTPGRADSFLKGNHQKRSRYAHQVSCASLSILIREAFQRLVIVNVGLLRGKKTQFIFVLVHCI